LGVCVLGGGGGSLCRGVLRDNHAGKETNMMGFDMQSITLMDALPSYIQIVKRGGVGWVGGGVCR